jgi:ABC-type transporter Mla MlaB component
MAIPARQSISLAIVGPIRRSDLPGLYERVCVRLSASPGAIVHCDVAGVEPSAVVVDALARLQLGARRTGCEIRLRNASRELLALVAFMGLEDVLSE